MRVGHACLHAGLRQSLATAGMLVGSTTLTSAGNTDVFVAKLDASGTPQWATKLGGTAADY